VRERVEEVAVAAVLRDEHLRLEVLEQRRHDRVEGAQPPVVADARRQRHVDGVALGLGAADVGREARAREEHPPLSCNEIVSTRSSSQKIRSTPSPWWTSTSTYATRCAPASRSRAMPAATSL
jgi:hypothetical protein